LLVAYSKFVAVMFGRGTVVENSLPGCRFGSGFGSFINGSNHINVEFRENVLSSHGIVKFIVCLVFKMGHVLV